MSAERVALLFPSMRNVPLRDMVTARFRPHAADADQRLFSQSTQVFNDHRPDVYPGPVTYFRARRRVPVAQHMLSAWGRIAPRMTVLDVPGAHHDVLGQVNVAEVARTWSRVLAERPARPPRDG